MSVRRACPFLLWIASAAILHAQPHTIQTTSGIIPTVGVGTLGHCAVATPDGGSIVCFNAFEPGMRKWHLAMGIMKNSPEGVVEWSRMTEIDDGIEDVSDREGIDGIRPKRIARNGDGNYVIVGELMRYGPEEYDPIAVVVIVVDPSGTYLHHHLYATEFQSCSAELSVIYPAACRPGEVRDVLLTETELIVLTMAGETTTLAWLTHDGALVRMRSLGWDAGERTSRPIWPCRIIADSSGGLVLFGRGFDEEAYRRRTTVTRLDSSGAVTASRHLPFHLDVWFGDAATLADGRILLVGSAVDTNVRSDMAMISSMDDEPSPQQLERMKFDEQYAYCVLDRALDGGRLTYLKSEGNDPGVERIVMLETGEIAIILSDDHDYGVESWGVTAYSLLSRDARYLSTVAMGPMASEIPGIMEPPSEDEFHWNPFARTGAFLLDDVLADPTGGMVLIGEDVRHTPLYAQVQPRLPFPCADDGEMAIDTLTRSFRLRNDSIRSDTFEPRRERLDRRFAVTQYEMPIGLLPLCNTGAVKETPSTDSATAEGVIIVENETISVGEMIDVIVTVPRAISIQIINADDAAIIGNRWAMAGSSRLSISTEGWEPGVYILSIEQGLSVKVLVRP